MTPIFKKNIKDDYPEIKKNVPEFVKYVEHKFIRNLIISLIICFIIALIGFCIRNKYPDIVPAGSIFLGIIGALIWGFGSLRTSRRIIVLSMARIGYSKSLADDFLDSNLLTFIGVFMVILSLII